jgi:hypothetical protein
MKVNLGGVQRVAPVALVALFALLLPGQAHAASADGNAVDHRVSAPPPDEVTIDPVVANGSGCKNATATVVVAPDNSGFTVTHNEFFAHAGLGAEPLDFRRNCQLNLQVNAPEGYTYAISRAARSGFLHLPDGATGLQRSSYYFQGSSQTESVNHDFDAPYSDYWRAVDHFDYKDLLWHPCGERRNLNINTELRVRAGSADPETTVSFMTLGTDGNAVSRYQFAWKRC